MQENKSGCFFLNTVYYRCYQYCCAAKAFAVNSNYLTVNRNQLFEFVECWIRFFTTWMSVLFPS